jgi:hypothetical protein
MFKIQGRKYVIEVEYARVCKTNHVVEGHWKSISTAKIVPKTDTREKKKAIKLVKRVKLNRLTSILLLHWIWLGASWHRSHRAAWMSTKGKTITPNKKAIHFQIYTHINVGIQTGQEEKIESKNQNHKI